jgi:zinc transporter ZupT
MGEPCLGSSIPTGVILRLEDIFHGVGVALDGEPVRASPFSVWFCSVLCSMVVILGLVVGCLVLV